LATNGLERPWAGNVWLNPPFGRGFAEWMHKINSEFGRGLVTQLICLIPVRTNAKWFRAFGNGTGVSLCFPPAIKFINGVTLEPSPTAAMMPNVICYLGHRHREFMECFREFGLVTHSSEAQS